MPKQLTWEAKEISRYSGGDAARTTVHVARAPNNQVDYIVWRTREGWVLTVTLFVGIESIHDLRDHAQREGFVRAADAQLIAEVYAAGKAQRIWEHNWSYDVIESDDDEGWSVGDDVGWRGRWWCECGAEGDGLANAGAAESAGRDHWRQAMSDLVEEV